MKIELQYVEKLIKLLSENNLSEITLQDGNESVIVKREANQPIVPVLPSTVTSQIITPSTEENNEVEKKGKAIVSPMVGTFYRAVSQNDIPFVEVGDVIAKGQVVCIVEAMKLMNEIESEFSGKITEICVQDGETVEFGQVLMYIE